MKFLAIYAIIMWFLYHFSVFITFFNELSLDIINSDKYFEFLSYIFPFPWFTVPATFYWGLFGFIFFMAGLQTLKRRTSGFYWFISLGYMNIALGCLSFLIFGFFINSISVFYNIIFGLIILYYFSRNKTLKKFNISNKRKRALFKEYRLFLILWLIIIGFYSSILMYQTIFRKPFTGDYNHIIKDEPSMSTSHKKEELFNTEIKLPLQYYIADIGLNTEGIDYVSFLSSHIQDIMVIHKKSYLERLFNNVGQKFGIKSINRFNHLLFNNKAGLFFQYIKLNRFSYAEEINLISGKHNKNIWLFEGTQKGKPFYEYHIFTDVPEKSISVNFVSQKDLDLREKYTQLCLNFSPLIYDLPVNYTSIALSLIEKKNYEEAKFYLINAINNYPDKASLYFYLGKCFYNENRVDNFLSEKYFNKALEIKPEHQKAKKMLEKINND
ncbi:MAG: tetratricopeptide repeat protein [Candidatus Muiribacteriota bacterium]